MRYWGTLLFLSTAFISCRDNGNGSVPQDVQAVFQYSPAPVLSQREILLHWAPQVYQDTRNDTVLGHGYEESADMIVRVDYDGDWYAGNNWDNLPANGGDYSSLAACAYTSFVETETHYFLGYGYFHAADDAIIPMDRHENDYEDVFLCIRKGAGETDPGTFEAIVMNYHGFRNLYTASDLSFTGSHPRIFISSNGDVIGGTNLLNVGEHGHGIEPYVPGNHKVGDDGVVYNAGERGEIPWETGGGAFTHHYDYELIDIAELWNRRYMYGNNPFKSFAAFGAEGEDSGAHAPFFHSIFHDPAAYFPGKGPALASSGDWSTTYLHNPYHENPSPVSSLPEGWTHTGIGPSTVTGEAYAFRNVFTLDGTGESPDAMQDHLEFLSVEVSSDLEIVARIGRLQQNISPDAFAGIMIRSSLDPDGVFVSLGVDPAGKISFRHRPGKGDTLVQDEGSTILFPAWVKLVREGNLFTAWSSVDGVTWSQEASGVNVSMSGSLEAGLAATSGNRDFAAAAIFDHVDISSR